MAKAWPKLKKELWAYGEDGADEIRKKVKHHLLVSTYHELSKQDAQTCMEQFEASEGPIVQYEETMEERDTFRTWKDGMVEKLNQRQSSDGKDIASVLRSSARFASRKKPVTPMFRDAIDSLHHVVPDSDGYELLESVAAMADAGELCQTAEARLQTRKRQIEEVAAVEKRRKINVTLDSDDLKSVGHVLVRAKSDATAMKIEAQNMIATAAVLEQNFTRHELL